MELLFLDGDRYRKMEIQNIKMEMSGGVEDGGERILIMQRSEMYLNQQQNQL